MERIAQKTLLYGVYALPLIVFATFGYLSFPTITEKSFIFRILVEGLFGIWLIMALRDPVYRPKISWIFLVLIDFLIIIGIANYFGADPYKSFWSNLERMEGYITLLHLLVYFVLLSTILQTQKQWRRFFMISIVASTVMALIALFQAIGIDGSSGRVAGLLGNASYLAVYLLFHIFFVVYVWMQQKPAGIQTAFFSSAILLLVSALVATGSRGALLGLLVAGIFTLCIIAVRENQVADYKKRALWLLLMIVIFITGAFALKDTTFIADSPTMSRFTSVSLESGTAHDRIVLWGIALQGAKEHQMFGWGQDNFEIVFNKYYDTRLANSEEWFDRAHNVFLEWFIAGGSIGAAFFVGIFIFTLLVLWRRVKTLTISEKAVLTGVLVAYVVQGMFTSDTLISYLFLFAVLAYIHSLAGVPLLEFLLMERKNKENPYTTDSKVPAVLIAIVTALVIYGLNCSALSSNKAFMQGFRTVAIHPEDAYSFFDKSLSIDSFGRPENTENFLFTTANMAFNTNVASTTKARYQERAFKEIDKQIAEKPRLARYPIHASFLSVRTGDINRALNYLSQAKQIAPKKEKIYIEEGIALYNYKRYNEALEAFKTAHTIAPNDRAGAEKYIIAAYKTLNDTEFMKVVEEVYGTTTPAQEYLIPLYEERNDLENIILIYNNLIEAHPNNLQNFISKAATLNALGRVEEAVTVLTQVKEIDPNTEKEIDIYITNLSQ